MAASKRLTCVFFRRANGTEPVREWLRSFPAEERRRLGEDIRTLELGWPLGMPLARPLGRGIWELRTNLTNRTARIFFCVQDDRMILLHGFLKTTRATPRRDIDLARQRMASIGAVR